MSDKEREDHLAAWRVSGLTRPAYCKASGLKYSTFMRWVSELGEKKEIEGQFVELPRRSAEEGAALHILLPNGVRVVTHQALDEALLKILADV